jgi:hypothetical protein
MTARAKLLASVPAALMLAVAAAQLTLVKTAELSPWKGGGFGMFATTDGGPNRHVRIYLEAGALAAGDHARVARAAQARRASGNAADAPHARATGHGDGNQARSEGHLADRVCVEVWRREYSEVTLAPEQVLLAEASVELDQHPH